MSAVPLAQGIVTDAKVVYGNTTIESVIIKIKINL
jgi:hypothetical protein